ncbi:hypothetical protein OG216_46395 (plasmid) [Streptomycetaceae bacterium NBC_01309]
MRYTGGRLRALTCLLTAGTTLLVVGCAQQRPTEPPAAFKQAVEGLLGSADFAAKTCASVFDTDSSAKVYAWADAEVPVNDIEDIRRKAVAAGWQPQQSSRHTLALADKEGHRIGLTARGDTATARAEHVECSVSVSSRLDRHDFDEPALEPHQRTALTGSFAAAVPLARWTLTAIGVAVDQQDTAFPADKDLDAADKAELGNCDTQTGLGGQWETRLEGQLPPTTEVTALHDRLAAGYPPGAATKTRIADERVWHDLVSDGAELNLFLDKRTSADGATVVEFSLTAKSACLSPKAT